MANSDKNVLITPNTGSTTAEPTIRFTGADNTPITLRVLDPGTLSFEGSAGQLFSIANGLTGTIFSVNDISGIPSLEILDTGLVKLAQYNGSVVIGASAAYQSVATSANAELSILSGTATTPGLILRAATSQTANLLEVQNSAGTGVLAAVSASGRLGIGVDATSGAMARVFNTTAADIGLIVRGAASQSGNLLSLQNSAGTQVLFVNSGGTISITQGQPITWNNGDNEIVGVSGFHLQFRTYNGVSAQTDALRITGGSTASGGQRVGIGTTSVSAKMHVVSSATNEPTARLQAIASQTANLQEWQNSSAANLAYVDASGNAKFVSIDGGSA